MKISLPVLSFIAAIAVTGTVVDAAAQQADRDQASSNFLQADANGDRALTLSEFTTLIDLNAESGLGQSAMIQRYGRYGMAFGRLDGDGDGQITTDELRAVIERVQR